MRHGAWPSAASVVDKALLELNQSIAGCAQGGATALSRPTQASSTHRHTHTGIERFDLLALLGILALLLLSRRR